MDHPGKAGLLELRNHLASGDVDAIRKTLFRLTDEERQLLRADVGDETFSRIYRAARRGRRGVKRGHVVLLHGIMGANLDSVKKSDRDRVWVNYWRLLNGRIKDFELTLDGKPVDSSVQVDTAGQNEKAYLAMLLELHAEWNAIPFAYDWRLNVRDSAARLAATIRGFAPDKPVHLVAHSMGGLVSRAFVRDFPEMWKSMRDDDGLRRGGRLVMLGTPNHGSFSIALALSGAEKKVRQLALLDRKHDRRGILQILNSFPGSYQMLPSPHVELGDDHVRLFRKSTWGTKPIHQPLLDVARRFHDDLRSVIDPERFVYVAGHGHKTPHRVRVDGKGKFSYKFTLDGDGRVPHVLGRLDEVVTYFVDDVHGSLARSDRVLGGIHELLETGRDPNLDLRPSSRRAPESDEWVQEPVEEVGELEQILSNETKSRSPRRSRLSEGDQMRVEALLRDDEPDDRDSATEDDEDSDSSGPSPRYPLRLEVVWGDITKVPGDVFAVGHYRDVLPQNAEFALDRAISNSNDVDQHILRQHTLRGNLRGDLGNVDFFPWHGRKGQPTVAIVGMGRPGTFGNDSLRVLIRKLVWAVSNLPGVEAVSSVLIGSGEGTLGVREAVQATLKGIVDALGAKDLHSEVTTVRIVEIYLDRAEKILAALREEVDRLGLRDHLDLRIPTKVKKRRGGWVSEEHATQMLFASLTAGSQRSATRGIGKAYRDIRNHAARQNPAAAGAFRDALEWAMKPRTSAPRKQEKEPVRMSFSRDAGGIRISAISDSATVSERVLRFDPKLIDDVVERINRTEERGATDFSEFITRLMLPRQFRDWLAGSGPFVFEVDRDMAQLHWEMLIHDLDVTDAGEPLGVRCQIARQIRTTYSPPPSRPLPVSGKLRALVVGDPGDPDEDDSLLGAREEALQIRALLEKSGVDVDLMVGAPNVPRRGALRGVEAATRISVLNALMRGGYDILHYSGHGDFDPEQPDRVGWVFASGLLSARELEGLEEAPRLIVANACLSGRTSQASAARKRAPDHVRESALLPSLADEFFRRGVRNYIGTAWSVSDEGAVLFAENFYKELLVNGTVGSATLTARKALHEERAIYDDLWAAYQHYGHPNSRLRSGSR